MLYAADILWHFSSTTNKERNNMKKLNQAEAFLKWMHENDDVFSYAHDAKRAIEEIDEFWCTPNYEPNNKTIANAIYALKNVGFIEMVRHGAWKITSDGMDYIIDYIETICPDGKDEDEDDDTCPLCAGEDDDYDDYDDADDEDYQTNEKTYAAMNVYKKSMDAYAAAMDAYKNAMELYKELIGG